MRVKPSALALVGAAAMVACGSPSVARTRATSSTPTPSTNSSPSAAPSATPAPPSFEPLLVAFDAHNHAMLMLASGQITVPIPSGPIVSGDATLEIAGPLGDRLIGTDGQLGGSTAPVSIVAVSSDGTLTTLEQGVAGSPSVIGRDDGQAWAWAVQTNAPACGSSSPATFDVYTDDGEGARKVASASFNSGVNVVTLASFTSAGIVASGSNTCGNYNSSTLTISPALLIDPATGGTTDLASRIGTDCNFDDMADNGTIVCSVDGTHGPAPVIRVVGPDGAQTNYSMSTWTSPHCTGPAGQLSADAAFAAIAVSCSVGPSTETVVLDLASGHGVLVNSGSNIAPALWTPDDVLIASDFGGEHTYAVTSSGTAMVINATYAAQASVG